MSPEVSEKLEAIETDDLIEEIESRGHEVDNQPDIDQFDDSAIESEYRARGLGGGAEELSEMFEAFYLGRIDRAIELAKKIAQDATGRFL